MIGGNAYVTAKAALEAHTVDLGAELADTGVTLKAYRPGSVDTAMQEWIRSQDESDVPHLHCHFHRTYREGLLITPAASAAALLPRLGGDATGQRPRYHPRSPWQRPTDRHQRTDQLATAGDSSFTSRSWQAGLRVGGAATARHRHCHRAGRETRPRARNTCGPVTSGSSPAFKV
jgi:NAD(P)-dependent dehydrogenase (short-subunit alcohol dehydrogenase family)